MKEWIAPMDQDRWWDTLLADVAAFEAAVGPTLSDQDAWDRRRAETSRNDVEALPKGLAVYDRWEGVTVERTDYGALVTATVRHPSLASGRLTARYAIARGARFPGAGEDEDQRRVFADEDLLEELNTGGWKTAAKHPERDPETGDVVFWMYNTWSVPWG